MITLPESSKELLKEVTADFPGLSAKRARTIVAETEELMSDTIQHVAEMHRWMQIMETSVALLPEIKLMLSTVSTAQHMMAQSAESMAQTFKKTEERYERMENRYVDLGNLATGKEQIPLKSHYWTLFATLLPTMVMSIAVVLGVLYATKYDINASLTSIQLNQRKTQELIESNEVLRDTDNKERKSDNLQERKDDSAERKALAPIIEENTEEQKANTEELKSNTEKLQSK